MDDSASAAQIKAATRRTFRSMLGTFQAYPQASRSAPVEKLWMNGRKLVDVATRKKIFAAIPD
jgi:hypothetical protein